MNIRPLAVIPKALDTLFTYVAIFSLLFRLDYFYCSFFHFTDSAPSILQLSSSIELFISVIVVFSSKFSIKFFKHVFMLKLAIFYCFFVF